MSQGPVDGFVPRVYNQSGKTIPYRLFIPPKYKKSEQYPLIIWLHGAGGSGTDNLLQIQGDQTPGTHLWTTPNNVARHPAFVLVPQSTGRWSALPVVPDVIEAIKAEFSIDRSRVYVIGQSMGGQAAWDLVAGHPETFAAAIFVCSTGGFPGSAKTVAGIPMWVFHGSNDPQVGRARETIDALRNAGGKPRYTEYQGMGHEIWDRVFKEPELAAWLFAQHKPQAR
jgi:predicted peptidase